MVDTLKTLCCNYIASNDIYEVLEPVADILPIEIVEHLFLKMDDFQLGHFSSFLPNGEDVQKLLLGRLKNLLEQSLDGYRKIQDYDGECTELEYLCYRYWKMQVKLALIKSQRAMQTGLLFEIGARVPHLIKHLNATDASMRNSVFSCVPRFHSVQCVSFTVDTYIKKWFEVATQWPYLRKMKLTLNKNDTLLPYLKDLLSAKRRKHENLVLSLCLTSPHCGPMYFSKLMDGLGDDIHEISGFNLLNHEHNRGYKEFLTIYSKVSCMKEIKVQHYRDTPEILLALIQDAPEYPVEGHALTKLQIDTSYFTRHNFYVIHHWRFSQLEHFEITNTYLGHSGAAILAEYATFWPFVKRFILRDCHIPAMGFAELLRNMVRGKGCEQLFELDLSLNDCDALEPFVKFWSCKEFPKLKIVRNFLVDFKGKQNSYYDLAINQRPLVLLEMSFSNILVKYLLAIFRLGFLSIPKSKLQELKIRIRSDSHYEAETYIADICKYLLARGIYCNQHAPRYNSADPGTFYISRGDMFVELYFKK